MGIVGNAASGKDTVARQLELRGFTHGSLSDSVRVEIIRRGMRVSRENQTAIANHFRNVVSPTFWVEQSLRKVDQDDDVVLSGIYAPSEAKCIAQYSRGVIVGLGKPQLAEEDLKTTYQRIASRNDGPRDDMSESEFIEAYMRENSGLVDSEANVAGLFTYAEIIEEDVFAAGALHNLIERIERSF